MQREILGWEDVKKCCPPITQITRIQRYSVNIFSNSQLKNSNTRHQELPKANKQTKIICVIRVIRGQKKPLCAAQAKKVHGLIGCIGWFSARKITPYRILKILPICGQKGAIVRSTMKSNKIP